MKTELLKLTLAFRGLSDDPEAEEDHLQDQDESLDDEEGDDEDDGVGGGSDSDNNEDSGNDFGAEE